MKIRPIFFLMLLVLVVKLPALEVYGKKEKQIQIQEQVDRSGKKWDGSHYSSNKVIQFKGAMDQINEYSFKGDEKVLDLGSGDGDITFSLSQRTRGNVIGIDKDSSMVHHANRTYKNPMLWFEEKDLLGIDYNEEFDLVTSFNMLHWEPRQEEALRKVHKSLKKGGCFLAGIPHILPPDKKVGTSAMVHIIKKLMQDKKWATYFTQYKNEWRFFSSDEYEKLLKEAKFDSPQVMVTVKSFPMTHNEFKSWMKSILPQLQYLPTEKREPFLEAILKDIKSSFPPNSQGKMNITHAQLEIGAKKL